MPDYRTSTVGHSGPVVEVKSPDYHLTPDAPLWASTHLHTVSGPPAISIHAGLEVGIVLAGREEIRVGDSSLQGDPGDVWLCAVSEPHHYRVTVPNTMNLVLVFLPAFLGEEMLGEKPWLTLFAVPPAKRPRVTTEALRSLVLDIAADLRREVEERQEGWRSAVRLGLLRLLFHLSRGWQYPGSEGGGRAYLGNLRRIMPALMVIHEKPSVPFSREEAARACGLGPSRFTMLFRETMGISFQTFRRRARIAFAANLLLTTNASVETIAEQAGFSDASHLHRAFVQEYGCTPGGYRDQRRLPAVKAPTEQTDPWAEPGSVSVRYSGSDRP